MVATANDPASLGAALSKRPGRFDRVALFAAPTPELRQDYLGRLSAGRLDPPAAASAHHRAGGRLAAATSNSVHPTRHSLVLLDFRRERPTQRSGVGRALETKFLRFWTGQERDGVPSLSPSPGFFRPGLVLVAPKPSFSAAARAAVVRFAVAASCVVQVERWGPAGSGELHSMLFLAGQPADVVPPLLSRACPAILGTELRSTSAITLPAPRAALTVQ